MRSKAVFSGIGFVTLLALAVPAQAHESGLSYLAVEVEAEQVTASIDAPAQDYDRRVPLSVDATGALSASTQKALERWLFANVRFVANGEVCDGQGFTPFLESDALLRLTGTWTCGSAPIETLDLATRALDTFGPGHSMFVRVENGPTVRQALLTNAESTVSFDFVRAERWWEAAGRFVVLGIQHIFEGIDHILFLLALLVLGGTLGRVVGIATAFTAAHSVTLSLAALDLLVFPERIVESAIAASIGWVAVENWIFAAPSTDEKEPLALRWRWVLTFLFGLVHGFGFAGVLGELGLPKNHLAVALASFNVGVEIGQVAIIALAWPLLKRAMRTPWYRPNAVRAASVLMFGIAVYWFIERAFELG